METFSIGQLSKRASVSNRTLRYYEELGLIAPKSRGSNRYRYYDDSHLQRLQTIKMLQDSGFALKEIVAALSPMLDPSGHVTYAGQEIAKKIFDALNVQKTKLTERQREIGQTIEELQKTMEHLRECFGCKLSSSLGDCAKCNSAPIEVKRIAFQAAEINEPHLNEAPLNGLANGHGLAGER